MSFPIQSIYLRNVVDLGGCLESAGRTVQAQIPLQVRSVFVLYELASSTDTMLLQTFFFRKQQELKKMPVVSSVIHQLLRAPQVKGAQGKSSVQEYSKEDGYEGEIGIPVALPE